MSVERLLSLNPGYQSDLIHAGDTLTISNAVPYLTVVDVERQSYLQDVAYSVEYQDDPSIYEGDYEVLEARRIRQEDVTANVTYINGAEVNRDVVAAVTLSQPTRSCRPGAPRAASLGGYGQPALALQRHYYLLLRLPGYRRGRGLPPTTAPWTSQPGTARPSTPPTAAPWCLRMGWRLRLRIPH